MKTNQRIIVAALLLAAFTAKADPDYGGYKGRGGMAAYAIKPNVYSYHYDKGFTSPDASGWELNLQFASSRIGAARSCGVMFDEGLVMTQLEARYPQGETVHRMVGIDFHGAQSKANAAVFCSPERVSELRDLLPAFEHGDLPRRS